MDSNKCEICGDNCNETTGRYELYYKFIITNKKCNICNDCMEWVKECIRYRRKKGKEDSIPLSVAEPNNW